jgi:hypothetical protein
MVGFPFTVRYTGVANNHWYILWLEFFQNLIEVHVAKFFNGTRQVIGGINPIYTLWKI